MFLHFNTSTVLSFLLIMRISGYSYFQNVKSCVFNSEKKHSKIVLINICTHPLSELICLRSVPRLRASGTTVSTLTVQVTLFSVTLHEAPGKIKNRQLRRSLRWF